MRVHFEEPPISTGEPAVDGVTSKTTSLEIIIPKPESSSSTISSTISNTTSMRDADESSCLSGSSLPAISLSSGDSISITLEDNVSCCSDAEEVLADPDHASFMSLRITYLIVTLVVMLADGLQGTHLYVLYEGYGFTVANLYCLGFVTGGLASPITGALVDKFGRKKSALLYCVLEICINRLEQYPMLAGLIFSRMVGGITTNLLSTVFDTWLDTEYRRRNIRKEGGYEIIMRDSVIVSNLAAIGSGYLAHILAERYGPKGPFEGAVACTSMALVVILLLWTENYGCKEQHNNHKKGMKEFLNDAVTAFQRDKAVLKLGIVQGLTCASIQIFIFLWSPALRHFAVSAPPGSIGIDANGEPAYGLIFGAFMAAGVMGGLAAPCARRWVAMCGQHTNDDRPTEALSTLCYLTSAFLLLLPCLLDGEGEHSFTICLVAFLIYEFMVGLYLPCEGVLRSIYFPAEGRASILTLPRIIVNCSVSVGVVLTNYMTMRSAFSSIVVLMVIAATLQLSLVVDFASWWSNNKTNTATNEQDEVKVIHPIKHKNLMTGVSRPPPINKTEVWNCAPDLKRASFSGDSDDSSLSSLDEATAGRKLKVQ